MKKKVIIGIVIFLIVLIILGSYLYYSNEIKGNFFESNNKDVVDEVSMIVKEGNLTSATIVIKNESNKELASGEWFRIDRLQEDGQWKELKIINDDYGFISIGWIINKNGEFEDKIDWSKLYGELKKGNYRIVKEVYENGNKIELHAEFIIK